MRAMKHALSFALVLALSTVAACGGGGKSTPTGPTSTAEPTPLEAGAWDAMSDKDRATFMKNVVVPVMGAKFKAFDAEEFAEVNCKTCHGPGAAEGRFEMPSGALPELDFNAPPDPDHAAINEFMANEVKPTMARLLGKPEYTPENPTGFGCLHCHTMAQAE